MDPVAAALGTGARIVRRERLNAQPDVWVFRCWLDGFAVPTVVAKQVATGVEPPPWFPEEDLHYRYLESVRFQRCPRVLARGPGLLVLEDLSPDPDPGDDAYGRALAATLAELHARTAGGYARYVGFRGGSGARPEANNALALESPALVRAGVEAVSSYGAALGVPVDPLRVAAARAIREVERETDEWWSLLHDDQATRRQAILSRGTLMLLDFERARFGHRLMDLAWVLAGKLQWKPVPGGYFLRTCGVGDDFVGTYRGELEARGLPPGSGFEEALAEAVLYATLNNVGQLLDVAGALPGVASPTATLHQILTVGATLLGEAPAAATLSALGARIAPPDL